MWIVPGAGLSRNSPSEASAPEMSSRAGPSDFSSRSPASVGATLRVVRVSREHHLCTNWQSHLKRLSREAAFTGFTAEAGKTYYFSAHVGYESAGDSVAMTLDLQPLNPDEGQYLVASNPVSNSHPQK